MFCPFLNLSTVIQSKVSLADLGDASFLQNINKFKIRLHSRQMMLGERLSFSLLLQFLKVIQNIS